MWRGEGRGAGYLGGGALTWAELFVFLKPNWEIIFLKKKVKVSLVDVVNCFVYIVSVLEKACVAKDLDMENKLEFDNSEI